MNFCELVLDATKKGTHLDVVGDDGDVAEVQRGVDLVHDVQRRGFVVVKGENQRQRAQRLLAARQIGNLLPGLLGRSHAATKPSGFIGNRIIDVHT